MLTRSRSAVVGSDGHDEIATSVVSGSIKPPMLENPEDWPTFKYQWRKYEESVPDASKRVKPWTRVSLRMEFGLMKTHPQTSSEDWFNSMDTELAPPKSTEQVFAAFDRLRYSAGDPITANRARRYITDARMILHEHDCLSKQDVPNASLTSMFVKGLQSDVLRRRVQCGLDENYKVEDREKLISAMNALVKAASELESFSAELYGGMPKTSPAATSHMKSRPRESSQKQYRSDSKAYQRTARDSESWRGESRPTPHWVQCYECGENGHRIAECPRRAGVRARAAAQWRRPRTGNHQQTKPKPVTKPEAEISKMVTAVEAKEAEPRALGRKHGAHVMARIPLGAGRFQEARCLLDTGSSKSFIQPALAERLIEDGVATRRELERVVELQGATEGTAQVTTAVTVPIQLSVNGTLCTAPVDCLLHDTGEEVLIGSSVLLELNWVDIGVKDWNDAVDGTGKQRVKHDPAQDFPDDASERSLRVHTRDISLTQESVQQRQEVATLLSEYDDVFAPPGKKPAKFPPMRLQVKPGAKLPWRNNKTMDLETEFKVQEVIADQLKKGWLRESTSVVRTALLPVDKGDDTVRLCQNFAPLNEALVDLYDWPMGDQAAVLEACAGCEFLTVLDASSGYSQILLDEKSRHLTAFQFKNKGYESTRMSQGLRQSPAYFCYVMSMLLDGVKDTNYWLDDICIASKDWQSHLSALRDVFARCKEFNFKLKPAKAQIGQRRAKVLGTIVGPDGRIEATDTRLQGIYEYPKPENVTKLRGFLGLCAFVTDHVPNLARVLAPLHGLVGNNKRKKARVPWTDELEAIFEQAKEMVKQAKPIYKPRYDQELVLAADASNEGFGAWLYNVRADGSKRPLGFFSKKFTPAQSKYAAVVQEAWAILASVRRWRRWLAGRQFTILSDHRNLLRWDKLENRLLQRWLLELQQYRYTLQFKPGVRPGTRSV